MAKILVVDDEPDMIWAISNVLLSENHSVVSVNSGEEALAKVKDNSIDLVLLDFRLPGMDGIQILEQIKRLRPELPVIMVTGYGGVEEAVQSIKLGAAHYLSKPFDNDQLVEAVSKALEMNTLKSGGLFGKRLAEKMGPTPKEDKKPSAPSVSKKSKNSVFPLVAAAFILVGFFLGGIFYFKAREASDREFVIAHSKVSGLAFSGNQLWVTDWFTQTIERYEFEGGKLTLIKTVTVPGAHLTGIAAGGGFLFTCDSWKKQIFKHVQDDRLTIAETYPSPGTDPSGLFFDGKYLWSCDGKTRKIYQHALDPTLTVLDTYDTAAQFPVGLYHDGGNFWTASAVGMKIYRNLLSERFRLDKTFTFDDAAVIAKPISAFTVQDSRFWLAYEGINKIYLKNPKKLKETTP